MPAVRATGATAAEERAVAAQQHAARVERQAAQAEQRVTETKQRVAERDRVLDATLSSFQELQQQHAATLEELA